MPESYVPTSPVSLTLDLLASILSSLPEVRTGLDVDSAAAALQRIVPGDAGMDCQAFQAWDGSHSPYQPPLIMLESLEPRYEQRGSSGWWVNHQINMVQIHRRVKTDSARAAYLRAWDDHGGLHAGIRSLLKTQLDVQGIFTVIAPSPFAKTAPPVLIGHFLSISAITYRKQQP